jgi:hypothetical protein
VSHTHRADTLLRNLITSSFARLLACLLVPTTTLLASTTAHLALPFTKHALTCTIHALHGIKHTFSSTQNSLLYVDHDSSCPNRALPGTNLMSPRLASHHRRLSLAPIPSFLSLHQPCLALPFLTPTPTNGKRDCWSVVTAGSAAHLLSSQVLQSRLDIRPLSKLC